MEEDGMKRRRHEEDDADVSRQMFSSLLLCCDEKRRTWRIDHWSETKMRERPGSICPICPCMDLRFQNCLLVLQ